MLLFFHILALLVQAALFTLSRWEVRGWENVPRRGGVVVVANHLSMLDPPLLYTSLRRHLVFLGKEGVFRSTVARLLLRVHLAVPVKQGSPNLQVLAEVLGLLRAGGAVAVFPEGTRSRTGVLQQGEPGAAFLALKAQVPLLPVGITGTWGKKGLRYYLSRPKIVVNVGVPFHLPQLGGRLTRESLQQATDQIMGHIAFLLPEQLRGAYGAASPRGTGRGKG